MFKKIIAAHDLHDGGRDAAALANQIAEATGAELVVAGVFPVAVEPFAFEPEWHAEEEQLAAAIQELADQYGAEAEAFPSSTPARGLHDLAEEIGADLVIVGSSKHSKVGETLAGNVALTLLHGSSCPVAVAPRGYREKAQQPRAIVVGVDRKPESGFAVREAAGLAKATGAPLKLIAAAEPPPIVYGKGAGPTQGASELMRAIEEMATANLEDAKSSVPDGVEFDASVVRGEAAEALVEAAGDDAILVLGSRGYGSLRGVLLGSVSRAVVRAARCPVLVHPRGAPVDDETADRAAAGSTA